MMSVNSVHTECFKRPATTPSEPGALDQAIRKLEEMIAAQRLNALPASFGLYRARQILERSRSERYHSYPVQLHDEK